MATINQIPMTIMGNIVKDLEPKRTAGGKTVVAFRVAQTSVTERNGRWEDGETTFIRCVAYGPLADHMISSGIRKGTRVVVTGPFRRTAGTELLKQEPDSGPWHPTDRHGPESFPRKEDRSKLG